MLAGLEAPDAGRIRIGDRTVFDREERVKLPPDKRDIGMVFQTYALWPHLTVRQNIAYPLKVRRRKRELADGWVERVAALVDCGSLLDRFPGQLSGGQQQRVALARGLVARPGLVLMDEPMSNLDAKLRDQVRTELHELHRRLGFTAVFVTHDQAEAFALGDRMAIMRSGRIEQLDTPEGVFGAPQTEYVADFIGMSNRLILQRNGRFWTTHGVDVVGFDGGPHAESTSLAYRLRPDHLAVLPRDCEPAPDLTAMRAEVLDVQYGGGHIDVVLAADGDRLAARLPADMSTSWLRSSVPHAVVQVAFRAEDGRAYTLRPDSEDPADIDYPALEEVAG
ncbi:ATP-binding cassette domain-containing protein, partial [Georgenia ruanii]|nr:ATP-binding cassette domain-containing protein [Georgenia ruanii]